VDHPGALGGVDEVAGEHHEGPAWVSAGTVDACRVDAGRAGGHVGEVVEQRLVAAPHKVCALDDADLHSLLQLYGVGVEGCLGEDPAGAVVQAHHGVVDVVADGEGQVGGQRPRSGGPGQHEHRSGLSSRSDASGRSDATGRVRATGRSTSLLGFAGAGSVVLIRCVMCVGRLGEPRRVVEEEGHRDRRVLAGAGGVVEADLVVRERGLRPPAVGQHPVGLIDQPFVPELLEGPHDRLHVVEVHGLVVVVEVDPAGLAGDDLLPFPGVAQHRAAAVLVEALDAVLDDRGPPADRQLLLGFHLRGQPVAVPAEAALHPLASHRLVAGHHVLHVAGEQMAVMRQPVGEGRAVVEDVLVVCRTGRHAALESAVVGPALKDPPLYRREIGTGSDRRIRLGLLGDHRRSG